ncbi:MAG: hypothetical protein ABI224_04415 [Acetobacteraceae bacterium]
MRLVLVFAALGLLAAPVNAHAQTPPPATPPQTVAPSAPQTVAPGEGQRAGQDFGNAGNSIADAARSAWHGVKHGWEATKEGARAGWNTAVHGESDPHPTH